MNTSYRDLKGNMAQLKKLVRNNYQGPLTQADIEDILKVDMPTVQRLELLKPLVATIMNEADRVQAFLIVARIQHMIEQILRQGERVVYEEGFSLSEWSRDEFDEGMNEIHPEMDKYLQMVTEASSWSNSWAEHQKSYIHYFSLLSEVGEPLNHFYQASNAAIAVEMREHVTSFINQPANIGFVLDEYLKTDADGNKYLDMDNEKVQQIIQDHEQRIMNSPSPDKMLKIWQSSLEKYLNDQAKPSAPTLEEIKVGEQQASGVPSPPPPPPFAERIPDAGTIVKMSDVLMQIKTIGALNDLCTSNSLEGDVGQKKLSVKQIQSYLHDFENKSQGLKSRREVNEKIVDVVKNGVTPENIAEVKNVVENNLKTCENITGVKQVMEQRAVGAAPKSSEPSSKR